MRLHFIRHTRPDIARGVCYGQSDIPLAASFAEEAEDVRARLTERLEGCTPTRIYSSPLSRCRHSVRRWATKPPSSDARLLELNFGEWELQRFDEITDPRLQLWYDDYLHVAPTGGESFTEQAARVADFIEELHNELAQNEDSSACEVLVSHTEESSYLLGFGLAGIPSRRPSATKVPMVRSVRWSCKP